MTHKDAPKVTYWHKMETVIVPNRWQGETGCVVGPFSSKTVAEYFANNVVDFGHFEGLIQQVIVRRDAYYVEVLES